MDYLKECMNDVGNPPIDVMNRNWCVGCARRECERAGLNQSAFDKRVKNWKSDLFDNVPRAAPDDRAYDNIRSKLFMVGGAPQAPKVSVFMPGVPPVARPEEPPAAPAPRPAAFVQAEPAREEPEPPPEPAAAEAPPPAPAPARAVSPPGNTPFEQGMILEGGPPAPSPAGPATGPESKPGTTFILEDD